MRLSSILQNRMFKETLIYSIGSFGSRILSFLLIPFYTYFFTKKELGEYDLLITTISLFGPLVSLQISDATYRWLIDKENVDNSRKERIITNSIFVYLIGYLIFSIGFFIYINFYDFQYQSYFIILIFLNCLLPLLQNILRGQGKTKQFAINGVVTSFMIVLFNIIFIYFFKLNIKGVFLANIVAYSIACLIIIYKIKLISYLSLKFLDLKLIKSLVYYSLPLIPNLMSWLVISSASKFIILHYMGMEDNGLYAVASRFPALLVVINSVLLMPLQDRILKENDDLLFNKLLYKFIVFELGLALILGIASPLMTKILVAPEYFETWQYMPYLYLGVGFNTIAAFLGLRYLRKKHTLKVTLTTVIGAFVSIGLCFMLIKQIGLQGVSISFLVGFQLVFFLRYWDIFKNKAFSIYILGILLTPLLSFFCIFILKEMMLYF